MTQLTNTDELLRQEFEALCPLCGDDKWHVTVINIGELVIPSAIVCSSEKCNGETQATITNGIID